MKEITVLFELNTRNLESIKKYFLLKSLDITCSCSEQEAYARLYRQMDISQTFRLHTSARLEYLNRCIASCSSVYEEARRLLCSPGSP